MLKLFRKNAKSALVMSAGSVLTFGLGLGMYIHAQDTHSELESKAAKAAMATGAAGVLASSLMLPKTGNNPVGSYGKGVLAGPETTEVKSGNRFEKFCNSLEDKVMDIREFMQGQSSSPAIETTAVNKPRNTSGYNPNAL